MGNGTEQQLENGVNIMNDYNYAALIYCKTFYLKEVDDDIYVAGVLNAIQSLTQREQLVLETFFQHGLKGEQLYNKIGLKESSANTAAMRAVEKLRDKSGQMKVSTAFKSRLELHEKVLKERFMELGKNSIDDLLVQIQGALQDAPINKEITCELENPALCISTLKLSTRTHNSLSKGGLNEIEKILAIRNFDGFSRVRNLGHLSFAELICKMREHGYEQWADKMETQLKAKQERKGLKAI